MLEVLKQLRLCSFLIGAVWELYIVDRKKKRFLPNATDNSRGNEEEQAFATYLFTVQLI